MHLSHRVERLADVSDGGRIDGWTGGGTHQRPGGRSVAKIKVDLAVLGRQLLVQAGIEGDRLGARDRCTDVAEPLGSFRGQRDGVSIIRGAGVDAFECHPLEE